MDEKYAYVPAAMIPYDQLTELAKLAEKRGKSHHELIGEAIDLLLQQNLTENRILLTGAEIAAISDTVGGKTLRTGADIVKLFQNNFKINVSGVELMLDPEDANIMHEQYDGFKGFVTFDQFVSDSIKDALSLYLWGSTRGVVTYR